MSCPHCRQSATGAHAPGCPSGHAIPDEPLPKIVRRLKLPIRAGEPLREVSQPLVISVSLFDQDGFFGNIYGSSATEAESLANEVIRAMNAHGLKDVQADCRRGYQRCSECDRLTCGDNPNEPPDGSGESTLRPRSGPSGTGDCP